MFAPPSAQEQAAAANAAKTRQDMDLQAQIAGMDPSAPNFKSVADLYYTTQGIRPHYYDIDEGNTTLRGNNIRDNETRVTTNSADNARALEERRMQESGLRERQLLEGFNVKEGENLFFPPHVAKELGVEPVLRGNISAAPGETITMPNAQGQVPRVEMPGPMQPGQPRPSMVDPNSQIKGQPKAEGSGGGVVIDPDGTVRVGGQFKNEWQTKDYAFAERMNNAIKVQNAALSDPAFTQRLTSPEAADVMKAILAAPGESSAMNILSNMTMDPALRQYYQAQLEIIAAYLRKDTGAAVTPKEFEYYSRMVSPMVGDDQATIERKLQAQNGFMNTLYEGVGRPRVGYNSPFGAAPAGAAPGAPPAAGSETWVRGADGKLQRAQ